MISKCKIESIHAFLKAYFDKLSAYYRKMFSWDHNVKWGESWFAKMGICPKS